MIDRFNPPTVHEPDGYSHVTISKVGRLAHLAGQCPLDLSGEVVGEPGDYAAQTEQVITNCLAVLKAAGVTPADVVRSVVYVVSPDSGVLSALWRQLNASSLVRPSPPPVHCWVWRRSATGGSSSRSTSPRHWTSGSCRAANSVHPVPRLLALFGTQCKAAGLLPPV